MYEFDSVSDMSSSQGTPGLDTGFYREATGSVAAELRSVGVQWMKYTRPSGSWDLSNTHIYIWANCIFASLLANKADGGLRVLVGDGTNVGYWYCEGSDTYAGGWVCLVADTSVALDSGSCTLTAVTEIGVGLNFASGAKNVESTWIDVARYGDGITVTSDTSCTLADIYAYSSADLDGRAHGIVRREGGVYFVQGKIRLGDASSGSITFEDASQIIIFEDKKVAADLYEIVIQGNAGGTTSVKFGAKSGGRGISGCIFKAAGTPKFDFTAVDTDIDALGLYGCTFFDAAIISLPPNAANREVLSCSFEKCGQVDPDTCAVQYCSFISADDRGILIDTASHNVTDCSFISCGHGVHCPISVAIDFDNLIFSGSNGSDKWDVEHSISGTLTINALPYANPSESYVEETGGGSTTINNTKVLKVTVLDKEDLAPVDLAQTSIYLLDSPYTELMNEDTDAQGVAQENYNYTADVDVVVKVRKTDDTDDPRYVGYSTISKITDEGLSLTVLLKQQLLPI